VMKKGDLVKANPACILGDEDQRAAGLRLLKNGIVVEVRCDGWVEVLWPNGRLSDAANPDSLLLMEPEHR
jgi:hypothetical protein